ncbi:MAG: hypothetical protein ACT4P3_21260 [Betaproteobacteria bacterium]
MRIFLTVLLFPAFVVEAQPYSRAGLREYSLQPHVLGSRSYDFEGGSQAQLDTGLGIALGVAHHVNDYLAFGYDVALATVDYRATVTPGAGNAGAAFHSSDVMDRATLRLNATWHLLARRSTPFLTANVGVTHLDPDVGPPPAAGCWIYPFWGQFCGAEPPTHGMTRLSAGAGAGWRFDLERNRGSVRLLVSGESIDWPGPPGALRNVELRADFGARF